MLTVLDPVTRRGRELCEALTEALPDQAHTYFHTSGTDEHLLAEVAGQARLVRPLDDLDELARCTALILTAPPAPAIAARLAAWLDSQPTLLVVDYSLPPVLPAGQAAAFGMLREPRPGARRLQALDPALSGPSVVLDALTHLGLISTHLTLLTPAADAGDEAVEELAGQAVARLSGARPPRAQRLPGVVAFDAGPVSSARHAHLCAQALQLGLPTVPSVTAVATSAFHGHLAAVTVGLDTERRRSELAAALPRRPQLQIVRPGKLGMVSAVVGDERVRCGEIVGGERSWSLLLAFDGGQLVGPATVVDLLARLTAA